MSEEDDDDTKGAVNMIKQFLGLAVCLHVLAVMDSVCMYVCIGVGDAIAEDPHWFPLSYKERDAGKVRKSLHNVRAYIACACIHYSLTGATAG